MMLLWLSSPISVVGGSWSGRTGMSHSRVSRAGSCQAIFTCSPTRRGCCSVAEPPWHHSWHRTPHAASSRNTVQLGQLDDRGRWSRGLGPVGVAGSFDVPLGHLALDQSGAGPEATDRVQTLAEQGDGVGPAAVSDLRGENRAPVRANGG